MGRGRRESSESPPASRGRGQSPEPKAHPVFSPSPSPSQESNPRHKLADVEESPVPEEVLQSKPLRATPDVRRGQRSPHPSPMTPKADHSFFRDRARALGLRDVDGPGPSKLSGERRGPVSRRLADSAPPQERRDRRDEREADEQEDDEEEDSGKEGRKEKGKWSRNKVRDRSFDEDEGGGGSQRGNGKSYKRADGSRKGFEGDEAEEEVQGGEGEPRNEGIGKSSKEGEKDRRRSEGRSREPRSQTDEEGYNRLPEQDRAEGLKVRKSGREERQGARGHDSEEEMERGGDRGEGDRKPWRRGREAEDVTAEEARGGEKAGRGESHRAGRQGHGSLEERPGRGERKRGWDAARDEERPGSDDDRWEGRRGARGDTESEGEEKGDEMDGRGHRAGRRDRDRDGDGDDREYSRGRRGSPSRDEEHRGRRVAFDPALGDGERDREADPRRLSRDSMRKRGYSEYPREDAREDWREGRDRGRDGREDGYGYEDNRRYGGEGRGRANGWVGRGEARYVRDREDEDRGWRGRGGRDEDSAPSDARIMSGSSSRDLKGKSSRGGEDTGPGADGKKTEGKDQAVEKAANGKIEVENGRTGGVYVPPFKLARMMREVNDKSSPEFQRLTWDALRKSINGLVNKVNASNIKNILPELFGENLVRGRGLFVRACLKSQMASPTFTHVFAALVAVVNTKFPELGELLLKRVVLQFRRAFRRNDKPVLLATTRFMAHLVNQQVAHEILALELLTLLLENPTDDSVEVAVSFVKECGAMLQDLSPQGLHGIFERFRGILHEGEIDKRVQFTIEGLFAVRKAKFDGHLPVLPELDLVEQEDQITHEISLEDTIDPETSLDIFRVDPNYLENEKTYETIKKEILGEESDEEERVEGEEDEEEDDEDEEEDEEAEAERQQIRDETETNLVNLRRTIYLTIMASVNFEEAGHKLMKIHLEPGQEKELCEMLLACCSQERTYLRYYGLLGQRFCMLNKVYQDYFDICFVNQYSMIHRLETNKLRNVAKLFAHLLATDAMPWGLLSYIRLTEEDTSSSSRIFIKILFQEMSEHLGLRKLNERLSDPSMGAAFEGIFPKDTPKNTRFAINFFTSIGLGGLTDGLREYLKNMPKLIMQQQQKVAESESEHGSDSESGSESESDSDSDSGSDSGSDTSESGTDSESESSGESESESESDRKRKRRKKK